MGWNEQRARAAGVEHRVIHTHPLSHAGYYPGAGYQPQPPKRTNRHRWLAGIGAAVVAAGLVVGGVAALVLWFLVNR